MNSQLESTLTQRGKRYGTFSENAYISQSIKDAMRNGRSWNVMASDVQEAIDQIAAKLSRIATGDPNYADNWHDIAGYAKLAEDRLNKTSVADPMLMTALGEK